MRHRRSAFTLVELLVVLAIAAMLAALLFPVFARSRRAAKASGCLSNLRQQYVALMLYLESSEERFPVINFAWEYDLQSEKLTQEEHEKRELDRPGSYAHVFRAYAPAGVFRCPADTGATFYQDLKLGPRPLPVWERFGTSYRPAAELADYDLTLGEVPDPTRILWSSDISGHWHRRDAGPPLRLDTDDFGRWETQVLYLDGHTRSSLTYEEAWLPYLTFLARISLRGGAR